MSKVLPGASREALSFISGHWPGLLKMSIIPIAVYMLVSYAQLHMMAGLYRAMGTMISGNTINPEFWGIYMRTMGIGMLGGILALCLMGVLFVQVVRYRKSGMANWVLTDAAGVKAGLLTLVYAIGIVMLTGLVYFGAALALGVVSAIVGALMAATGSASAVGAVLGLLIILGALAVLAFLYWFAFRFFVGLPGVALGHAPDFFKDMWPLSKGESWGVPLRMILATVIIYVPLAAVMLTFMWPSIKSFVTAQQ